MTVGACLGGKYREEPYAEQRREDDQNRNELAYLAHALEDIAVRLRKLHTGRGVSIAATNLQEAAMWLNRAYFRKD